MNEVYVVVEQTDYHGYDLPEGCFASYEDALSHLNEIAKRMRLKVRKGDYIKISGGTIEIHALKIVGTPCSTI